MKQTVLPFTAAVRLASLRTLSYKASPSRKSMTPSAVFRGRTPSRGYEMPSRMVTSRMGVASLRSRRSRSMSRKSKSRK